MQTCCWAFLWWYVLSQDPESVLGVQLERGGMGRKNAFWNTLISILSGCHTFDDLQWSPVNGLLLKHLFGIQYIVLSGGDQCTSHLELTSTETSVREEG